MSQDINQSINQDGGQQLTEVACELRTKTLLSNFKITEGAKPGDRFYEMRHYRASMVRWQEDGSVLIVATGLTRRRRTMKYAEANPVLSERRMCFAVEREFDLADSRS